MPAHRGDGPLIPVLMYHAIGQVDDPALRALAVPVTRLREQLTALAGAGYQLTGLTRARSLVAADPHARVVALTFDDGYRDFLTDALPVLTELSASATLYLPPEHLDRGTADWLGAAAAQFGPLLRWPEVREVAEAGVEIGSHNLVHHAVDTLPAIQRDREIRDARDRLTEAIGAPVSSFCYPHGYHSRAVRTAVAAAGHDTACEIGYRVYRLGEDRFAIPRLQPTPDHRGADLLRLIRTDRPAMGVQVKRAARPGWRATRLIADRMFGRRIT